jgi:photosystem II stability/assembly factor-like uncharacterized protein
MINSFIKTIFAVCFSVIFITITFTTYGFGQTNSGQLFNGLKARSIGPSSMGGRITAVEALESNPFVIYVGAASGGVWKSENGGQTWNSIFDENDNISVGALKINQNNPDIIWVGTGEGNVRNSAMVGRGVYKSMDGGNTWKNLGLNNSEHINQIALHPTDPNIAYVMALGKLWGPNEERGVFKTIDGGVSWQKILYVNDRTGGHEMIIDVANSDHLIVSMWQFSRTSYDFTSGGEGSGLYESLDGGKSFSQITNRRGFLSGPLGKIGLSQSLSEPNIIYAMAEAKKSALLKSVDGGKSWKIVNDNDGVMPRPFYFGDIIVDPTDAKRLYKLEVVTNVSDDGGASFTDLFADEILHGDHHALWINPKDPNYMIDGNDGGIAISYDKGKNWDFTANIPLGQFYHISVDNDYPYNIYGGLQDNGSWMGPSEVWEIGGIRNHHWKWWLYMDGFEVLPDPDDSRFGYGMGQNGWLMKWDRVTGQEKIIQPVNTIDPTMSLRFNWNTGFAINPFNANEIYLGSQYIHKSSDKGETWTTISEDLTTDNPDQQNQVSSGGITRDNTGAENYNTISSIAPSTITNGVIWAGTDDGQIHLSRDGGKNWLDISDKIPRKAQGAYINHIEPSSYEDSVAFVAMNDHRRNKWAPLLFRVENYGQKWVDITTSDIDGFTHVIKQDHINPDLLFAGAEFGLHISQDGGKSWFKHIAGIPPVSVHDLAIQSREDDLVIGTHGRGIYIIDDYSLLRETKKTSDEFKIIDITDAQQYQKSAPMGPLRPGFAEYSADNEPYGAVISWTAKEVTNASVTIKDQTGAVIRRFDIHGHKGVNRNVWDLKTDGYRPYPGRNTDAPSLAGPEVPPGIYTATIGENAPVSFKVLKDPRFDMSDDDYAYRYKIVRQGYDQHGQMIYLLAKLHVTKTNIETTIKNIVLKLQDKSIPDNQKEYLINLKKDLDTNYNILCRFEARLSGKRDVLETETLSSIIFRNRWMLTSNFERPSQNNLDRIALIQGKIDTVKRDIDTFYKDHHQALINKIDEFYQSNE